MYRSSISDGNVGKLFLPSRSGVIDGIGSLLKKYEPFFVEGASFRSNKAASFQLAFFSSKLDNVVQVSLLPKMPERKMLVLSQTSEYALRAVVHLAYNQPDPSTTDEIAESTKVPRAYLAKVLQALVRHGIIRSQRGVRGGVMLARSPAELTILEVVNAVDPIVRIRTCPLGLKSHGIRLCPLHSRLDLAIAGVEEAFRKTTLQEVLSEPSNSIPLCEFPMIKSLPNESAEKTKTKKNESTNSINEKPSIKTKKKAQKGK